MNSKLQSKQTLFSGKINQCTRLIEVNNPNIYINSKTKLYKHERDPWWNCNCYGNHRACDWRCQNFKAHFTCNQGEFLCSQMDKAQCLNRMSARFPNTNVNYGCALAKGQGLFATADIDSHSFITEYTGEVFHVNSKILKYREAVYSRSTHTFQFSLNSNFVIDATQYGNWGRYINHSHDPNCQPLQFHDNGEPKIFIFSNRKIKTGEELSYDYNLQINGAQKLLPCFCNANNCSGFMGIRSRTLNRHLQKQNLTLDQFKQQQATLPIIKQSQRCAKCQQVGHKQNNCQKFGYKLQKKPKRIRKRRNPIQVAKYNKNYQQKLKDDGRKRERKSYHQKYRQRIRKQKQLITNYLNKLIDDVIIETQNEIRAVVQSKKQVRNAACCNDNDQLSNPQLQFLTQSVLIKRPISIITALTYCDNSVIEQIKRNSTRKTKKKTKKNNKKKIKKKIVKLDAHLLSQTYFGKYEQISQVKGDSKTDQLRALGQMCSETVKLEKQIPSSPNTKKSPKIQAKKVEG